MADGKDTEQKKEEAVEASATEQEKDGAVKTPPAEQKKEETSSPSRIKVILKTIQGFFQKLKSNPLLIKLKQFIERLGWKGWSKIGLSLLLIFFIFNTQLLVPYLKNIWSFPYMSSYQDVGDKIELLSTEDKLLIYSSELLAPQNIIQLNKIVVNLKPSSTSTSNPMMAFDLYIKTDSEAASVEIKSREKQFQDHLQRFTESLSYDQILSESAKQQWKIKMKRELNAILNSGRIIDIYFNNLIIKP